MGEEGREGEREMKVAEFLGGFAVSFAGTLYKDAENPELMQVKPLPTSSQIQQGRGRGRGWGGGSKQAGKNGEADGMERSSGRKRE